MKGQKKEPNPAKGSALIGNRLHGTSNLANLSTANNANERRILAELEQTLVCGHSTYFRVCRALEAKFERVQNG